MKKKITYLILAIAMVLSFASCSKDDKKEEVPVQQEIKNVILLIPDGGGYGNFDFANDVKEKGGFLSEDFANRTPVEKSSMFMKDYLAGSAITNNVYGELTDSAAAGNAIATGHKTVNGYIGIDQNMKPKASILEAAQSLGKATGIISTYEWMHATPASFTAHAESRSDYKTLYKQIENQKLDVVLGSGYGAVQQYGATIDNAKNNGYKIVENRKDLENVKAGDKLWGNATQTSSPLDIHLTEEQPTLAQMTKAAITALSGDQDGFFLMVEGSKVDSGGHSNDAVVTTSEYMAFDAAFKVAVEFAKERNDTVVIAIPDHDTGAMKYDEIKDKFAALSMVRMGIDTDDVEWGTTSHSTQNVGIWIYAPEGVEIIEGLNSNKGDSKKQREDFVIENTEITPYIADLFGVDLEKITNELFVDVTNIGTYDEESLTFTFNKGQRSVTANESVYLKNGKSVDMQGKVAIFVGERFYVPKSILTEDDIDDIKSSIFANVGADNKPDYKVSGLVVSPKEITLKKGESAKLSAIVEGENNPPQDVTYSIETSNTSEATTIDEQGTLVIGNDEENSQLVILAKSAVDGSKIDSCNVTIE